MIANEINRAKNWIEKKDFEKVSNCYERAFELIDFTVDGSKDKSFIRELLRFREILAINYSKNTQSYPNYTLYNLLLSMNVVSYNLLRG
ncbi:MAG: hypothetical protein U9R23_03000 [Candidatus Cloacimonadota bacterium]|nr:hypothetical protein [Candidatus Cloacimonadota bacterium]